MTTTKFLLTSVSVVALLAINFVLLFLIAPALVSAASTISVIAGIAIVFAVLIGNATLAFHYISKFLNKTKENS